MHRLLTEQIKNVGLKNSMELPDEQQYEDLLNVVSNTYAADDERCEVLQHTLETSRSELNALYRKLQSSSQKHIDAIANAIPDLVLLIDYKGTYLDVFSSGGLEDSYVNKDDLLNKNVREILPEDLAEDFLYVIEKALGKNRMEILEYELDVASQTICFEARVIPAGFKKSGIDTVVAIVRNITQRKRMEDHLHMISKVFEETREGIIIEDSEHKVITVNDAALKITGLSEAEVIGRKIDYFFRFLDDKTAVEIRQAIESSGTWQGETVIKRTEHEDIPVWMTINTVYNKNKQPINYVVMAADISEIYRSREQLEHAATHDSLTGLPNRTLLYDRLESALHRCRRRKCMGAVLFLDMDDFKEINDNLGHSWGDELLLQCSQRLRHVMRAEDTVGRLGGDEFLIIVEDVESRRNIEKIAQNVLNCFTEPFKLAENEYAISVSIGISTFHEDGDCPEDLISAADQAMYYVKKSGKDSYQITSAALKKRSLESFTLEQAIKKAEREDSFLLRYQPMIEIDSGRVVGVEALVRIRNDELGLLMPNEFLHLSEQTGSIIKIGKWVIEKVCTQITEWKKEGIFDFNVAINLSRRQLNDELLIDFIEKISRKYTIRSGELEFDVSEKTLLQNEKTANENMGHLYVLGYKLVIDDFGSGDSSLSNLKMFALDKLKIDKAFIREMFDDEGNQAIVEAAIALGKSFGLKVIADGVESKEQELFLRRNGCDEIQGFLYSEPVSAKEISEIVKERNG